MLDVSPRCLSSGRRRFVWGPGRGSNHDRAHRGPSSPPSQAVTRTSSLRGHCPSLSRTPCSEPPSTPSRGIFSRVSWPEGLSASVCAVGVSASSLHWLPLRGALPGQGQGVLLRHPALGPAGGGGRRVCGVPSLQGTVHFSHPPDPQHPGSSGPLTAPAVFRTRTRKGHRTYRAFGRHALPASLPQQIPDSCHLALIRWPPGIGETSLRGTDAFLSRAVFSRRTL